MRCATSGRPCVSARPSLGTLERAIRRVGQIAAAECPRPRTSDLPESRLWEVLVSCVLGSATKYEDAECAMHRLKGGALLNAWEAAFDEGELVSDTRIRLRDRTSIGRAYRFPETRARWLAEAASSIYGQKDSLAALLAAYQDPLDIRRLLSSSVRGLGPKQSSLFLRNIGISDDLAVIDRHVLRYLWWSGLADSVAPPASLSRYERLEDLLRRRAWAVGLPLGVFDIAVWVVMRTAQEEAA